jgi:hypothetical protein
MPFETVEDYILIISIFVNIGLLIGLILQVKAGNKQTKHSEISSNFTVAPYLTPFLIWNDKIKKDYRILHIKNIGNGVATNVSMEVIVENEKKESHSFQRNRATFTPDSESNNTKISLTNNCTIKLIATCYDVVGRKYEVHDSYEYFKYDDNLKQILRDRKIIDAENYS